MDSDLATVIRFSKLAFTEELAGVSARVGELRWRRWVGGVCAALVATHSRPGASGRRLAWRELWAPLRVAWSHGIRQRAGIWTL